MQSCMLFFLGTVKSNCRALPFSYSLTKVVGGDCCETASYFCICGFCSVIKSFFLEKRVY